MTPARPHSPSAPPGASGDRLVLEVDDEPDLLEIVSDRLRGAGYQVATAQDGLEAIQQARALRPDCVILDLKMPRLGGFDALPGLRQVLPHAYILVLTGSPNRPLGEACRTRGADDFLLKPFDPGDLLRRLAQAVACHRGR